MMCTSVVSIEDIFIRSQYLNPVGYYLDKTLSMGILHPPHLIPSLVLTFSAFNLKNKQYKLELALQILPQVVS